MDWWIEITSAGGTRYGELHQAANWQQTNPLDAAGSFGFELAAADPLASLVQVKRVATCKAVINGAVVEIGAGVIDEIALEVDGSGAPTGGLAISGANLLRELTYRHVGALVIDDGSGGADVTGPADIMALAPAGWSLDVVNGYDETLKSIVHTYEGESVLAALVRLAEMTGEHFRVGAGRTVVWMQADQPDSGVTAVLGIDGLEIEGEAARCAIVQIGQMADAYDSYIGRVYAIGVGNGDAKITLDGATVPGGYSGYSLGNDAKGHYLEHAATWASYGIERYASWKDIDQAQTLMEAAYEFLRRSLTANVTYQVEVTGLQTTLTPGSTMRVIAHQWVDGYHAVNIDGDLIVLETTDELTVEGLRTVGLKVASVDRWPLTDTGAVVGGLGESQNAYTHTQPVGGDSLPTHKTSHQNGGTDEISVAGLSGVLADPQTAAAHAASHESSGGDVISALGPISVSGSIRQQTNMVRFVKVVTGIADNTATEVFRITTTNETGSSDGGGYSVLVHAVIGHAAVQSTTGAAAKSFTAQFCRVIRGAGDIGVSSAVSEVVETASAATNPTGRDIGTVTMTVTEISEYVVSVQFTIDLTGTSVSTAQVAVAVELVYTGFVTAPVIS